MNRFYLSAVLLVLALLNICLNEAVGAAPLAKDSSSLLKSDQVSEESKDRDNSWQRFSELLHRQRYPDEKSFDDDDDEQHCFCNLTLVQVEESVRCAKAYWLNQVGNRSVDPWAANCFDQDMVSAPLSVAVLFGKDAVFAGWSQVSRTDANGNPYFEDNPYSEITTVGWGCTEDQEFFVQVNLQRELKYWATGKSQLIPYTSTFIFRHNSSDHIPPESGVPDYTIRMLEYMPQMLKELVLWPSQPLIEDPTAQNYACSYLNSACHGLVDWSPQTNCWEWMQNHALTGPPPFLDYSYPAVPETQHCVYFMSFLNNSPTPRTTYCPALALCTGNFVPPPGKRDIDVDFESSRLRALTSSERSISVYDYLNKLEQA